ncbi:MAG: hypothetical protein ACRC28_18515 [Clostridium sp.]|uniref:hypothetical protein n=1 Tax=Clostridium sp. TaxID=1506 RepID=UPI003F2C9B2A
MRLSKCYGEECLKTDKKWDKSQLVKDGGKNYCPSCYQIRRQFVEERTKLFEYIKVIFDIPYVTPMIQKQANNFQEKYNISYREQRLTLNYMVNRLKMKLDLKYGITLIGNYHLQMVQAYKELQEKQKQIAKFEIKKQEVQVAVATKRKKNNNLKQIDMSIFD